MTFQFLCPQGHLLEGDESQMGQPCDCPMCGMRFLIPTLPGAAPATGYAASGYEPEPAGGGFDFQSAGPIDPFASVTETDAGYAGETGEIPAPLEDATPQLVHIPCPEGHELETPYDMIGQDVLCPYCGVQFNLRYKDSVEYKEERAKELERREQKAGKLWFQWAIIATVVVMAGLVGMIIYGIQNRAQ